MFRKLLSIILVVALTGTFAMPALAAEISNGVADKKKALTVEEAADRVRSEIPNAQVMTENGKIYVVVEKLSDIPLFNTDSGLTRTTNEVSVNGGSYRNFQPPLFASFYPYSQVYMKEEVVDGLMMYMTQPDIIRLILEYSAAGYLTSQIIAAVKAAYGVTLSSFLVGLVCSIGVWTISNAEYWALNAAQSTNGRASVVRGRTVDGYEQYFYSPWTDYNCPTYSGYEATWFEGVYDVAQAN